VLGWIQSGCELQQRSFLPNQRCLLCDGNGRSALQASGPLAGHSRFNSIVQFRHHAERQRKYALLITHMKIPNRFIQDESGSGLVETAFSLILLLMTIFGVIYFAEALYTYEFVSYAAQQGTRYAIVRGGSWGSAVCTSTTTLECNATAANITSYVQSLTPQGITASSVVISATWPGLTVNGSAAGCTTVNSQGCLVKVQASYPFSFVVPFLSSTSLNFTGTSEEAIQH
jgi:Flp pilus assembly protein TadG